MSPTYWRDLLAEWQSAIIKRNVDSFFIESVENRQNMQTKYSSMGSVQAFTDYLIKMASEETLYGNDPLNQNVMRNSTFAVGEY